MPLANNRNLAIIGGGASAALLLANLARLSPGLSVDVYDRSGRFGRGIAYSTARLCHLLNVRAMGMSAFETDKEHFTRWSEAHGYAAMDFVPRRLYGDYLQSLWREAEKSLDIRSFTTDIPACRRQAGGYEIGGRAYENAVLATGNARPLGPAVKAVHPLYYADPWGLDERVKDARTIALIGAGLTAVDAVLSLEDIGFTGEIVIFSRHALLPLVHAEPQAWDLPAPSGGPLPVLRFLRAQTAAAMAQGVRWQSVIDAMRSHTNRLWQEFSAEEKARFLRHLYTLWGVHRHRMAPQIAGKIEALRKTGRLHLVSSRVRDVGAQGDDVLISLPSGAIKTFGAAVNCMGYRYDEPGREFDVSHKIGPARFGELFETTAIPEIRAQAHALANAIAEKRRPA